MRPVTLLYNVSLLFFWGCAAPSSPSTESSMPPPSDNPALNTVSPTQHRPGYLQRSYERWEKEEWEPATKETAATTPAEKTDKKTPEERTAVPAASSSRPEGNGKSGGALQHYIDKWGRYLDSEKDAESRPSHVEELNRMPGIGNGER